MTNPSQRHEEKARELWANFDTSGDNVHQLASALASAEAEEREACAKIVEGDNPRGVEERAFLAAAVRARGGEQHNG